MCEYIDLGPAFTIKSSKDKWSLRSYPFLDWKERENYPISRIYMSKLFYNELKEYNKQNNIITNHYKEYTIKYNS